MSLSLTRENYFWHKVHSLTGIVPVGFYMVQHLTLNSFAVGGPEYFNNVIRFFEGMPKHFLLALEIVAIWIPLAFHAIYGLFIVGRAQPNYANAKYKWNHNLMYVLQRWSGILLFFFLIYHIISTTGEKYIKNNAEVIMYAAWQEKLLANGGLLLVVYAVCTMAAAYHLAYGIWNFCIRWGITVSDRAQISVQKFATFAFVALTLLAWSALAGFLIHRV